MLKQIERSDSLVEVVLQQITDAIVSGQLKPDNKLVESRIADQLGVSRGPVREAIRRLEQMGIVEKIAYRGTFVSTLSDDDIDELYSVRELLEGQAARMIAEKGDEQAIAELEEILNEMQQAAQSGDSSRVIELDADFHDALISLSGHRLMGEMWESVSIRMRRFLLLKTKRAYRTLKEAVELHAPIVRAISSGDTNLAEFEARRHISETVKRWNG